MQKTCARVHRDDYSLRAELLRHEAPDLTDVEAECDQAGDFVADKQRVRKFS